LTQKKHRFFIIIFITLVAAGFAYSANSIKPFENRKFFDFPLNVNGWMGEDIPMSEYVYRGIETPYLFLRNYYSARSQVPVNLSIVWFDDTNIAFHAPEACLGGVGERVKEKTSFIAPINDQKTLEMGKLIVGGDKGRKQLVLYYFDVDGYSTISQKEIRLHVLLKRLTFKRSSASFIRLMTPIVTTEQDASDFLLDFVRTVYPLIPEYTYTNKIRS